MQQPARPPITLAELGTQSPELRAAWAVSHTHGATKAVHVLRAELLWWCDQHTPSLDLAAVVEQLLPLLRTQLAAPRK